MFPSCVYVCVCEHRTARPTDPQISRYCSSMNDPDKRRGKRPWSPASMGYWQLKSIMDNIVINPDHFLLVEDKRLGVGWQCLQTECFQTWMVTKFCVSPTLIIREDLPVSLYSLMLFIPDIIILDLAVFLQLLSGFFLH